MLTETPGRPSAQRLTLADHFGQVFSSSAPYLQYDNGYRSWCYTYAQVGAAARTFSAKLHAQAVTKGDKIIFWSENRPEWIAAFWGCVVDGIIVVPIDYRDSCRRPRKAVAWRTRYPANSGKPRMEEQKASITKAGAADICHDHIWSHDVAWSPTLAYDTPGTIVEVALALTGKRIQPGRSFCQALTRWGNPLQSLILRHLHKDNHFRLPLCR